MSAVEVTHSCGHDWTHDLIKVAENKRENRAAWLATTKCTDCWSKGKRRALSRERQAERAAEQAVAEEDQKRSQLRLLRGSVKQVPWALQLRYQLLRDAYTSQVEEGELSDDDFEEMFLAPARQIPYAGWWIDNKDVTEPDMILRTFAQTPVRTSQRRPRTLS